MSPPHQCFEVVGVEVLEDVVGALDDFDLVVKLVVRNCLVRVNLSDLRPDTFVLLWDVHLTLVVLNCLVELGDGFFILLLRKQLIAFSLEFEQLGFDFSEPCKFLFAQLFLPFLILSCFCCGSCCDLIGIVCAPCVLQYELLAPLNRLNRLTVVWLRSLDVEQVIDGLFVLFQSFV